MERYSRWHLTEFIGDQELGKRYLAEGRKYLGYVVEQRQASNIGQLQWRTTNAEGVKFEVSIVGEIPSLKIDVRDVGGPSIIPLMLEGFIVRPNAETDQYANTDLNHILLQPTGTTFRPWFFDEAHTAPGYEGSPQYNAVFPEGISRYGNVDWRPADQSVVLSWYGPSARYFGYNSNVYGTEPYVYIHGQLLLDVNDIDYAIFEPVYPAGVDDQLRVRGACVRGNNLWVIAHDESTLETLLRIPLTSEMRKKAQGAGLDARAVFFADVTAQVASAEVMAAYDSDGATTGAHPYFFNSSGTEARRIYYDNGLDATVEAVLTEDEDGAWAYSESHVEITATATWEADREYSAPGSYTDTWWEQTNPDYGVDPYEAPSVVSHTNSSSYPVHYDEVNEEVAHAYYAPITQSTITFTSAPSTERQKLAVDFWNGAWRYAYEYLRSETQTSTYTAEVVVDWSFDTGYYHSWISSAEDDPDVVLSEISSPRTKTENINFEGNGVEAFNLRTGGISTDFFQAYSGTTRNNTFTYTAASTFELNQPGGKVEFGALEDTIDETQSASYDRNMVTAEFESQVEYMDLRFEIAYFQTYTETNTTTIGGSGEGTRTTVGTGTPGGEDTETTGSMSWELPDMESTLATTEQWDTRLIINGQQVVNFVESSGSGSDTTHSIPDTAIDWISLFLTTPGYSATPVTPSIVSIPAWLSSVGFVLTAPTGYGSAWHAVYAHLAAEGGGTGTYPVTYTDSDPATVTFATPTVGMCGVTSDWSDSTQEVAGSWLYVLGRRLADYQNAEHTDGAPQFARTSSMAGVDALLAAYPEAVRFYPVGYVSKVIAAVDGPTGRVRIF